MTGRYDLIGCAKRIGAVLIGKTEPSVLAVTEAAGEVIRTAAVIKMEPLRSLYNATVAEGIPDDFRHLVDSLDQKTVIPIGVRRAAR